MFRLDSISTFVYMYLHNIYRYACIYASQVWVRSCTLNKTLNSESLHPLLSTLLLAWEGCCKVSASREYSASGVEVYAQRSSVCNASSMLPARQQATSCNKLPHNTAPQSSDADAQFSRFRCRLSLCLRFPSRQLSKKAPADSHQPFQASFPAFAPAKTHLTRREL